MLLNLTTIRSLNSVAVFRSLSGLSAVLDCVRLGSMSTFRPRGPSQICLFSCLLGHTCPHEGFWIRNGSSLLGPCECRHALILKLMGHMLNCLIQVVLLSWKVCVFVCISNDCRVFVEEGASVWQTASWSDRLIGTILVVVGWLSWILLGNTCGSSWSCSGVGIFCSLVHSCTYSMEFSYLRIAMKIDVLISWTHWSSPVVAAREQVTCTCRKHMDWVRIEACQLVGYPSARLLIWMDVVCLVYHFVFRLIGSISQCRLRNIWVRSWGSWHNLVLYVVAIRYNAFLLLLVVVIRSCFGTPWLVLVSRIKRGCLSGLVVVLGWLWTSLQN